jgi:hypothetical protein
MPTAPSTSTSAPTLPELLASDLSIFALADAIVRDSALLAAWDARRNEQARRPRPAELAAFKLSVPAEQAAQMIQVAASQPRKPRRPK